MNIIKCIALAAIPCSLAHALPLARISGDGNPTLIDRRLIVGVTGNTGENPSQTELGSGYWTDTEQTGRTASSASVTSTISFTGRRLGSSGQLDLTRISFNYVRGNLDNGAPIMEVYIDTGDGYGSSVLTVNNTPASNAETQAFSIELDEPLKNNQSVTFGFSFGDNKGRNNRTHLITNVFLEGTYDLPSEQPGIDINLNGVSDIWEYQFGATDLIKDIESQNQDQDGDGFTNIQEATSGTNPFDANSRLRLGIEQNDKSNAILSIPTVLGKDYKIFSSDDLTSSSWTEMDSSFIGNGSLEELITQTDRNDRQFYRAEVDDIDGDGDRLTASEELSIPGFSDNSANSASASDSSTTGTDYQQLKSILQSAFESSVTITSSATTVYEDRPQDSPLITFTRTSSRGDAFLNLQASLTYQLIDTTLVSSNAASTSDYRLIDSNGVELTDGLVIIPAGQASATIRVEAIPDDVIESDEQVTLSVVGGGKLNFWIADTRTEEAADYIAISRAGLFLSQASMGGTPATISALANKIKTEGYIPACEAWIDEQIALPRESTVTADCYQVQADYLNGETVPSKNIQNFELVWWGKVTATNEQLRHRMAYSLSQIFVTSAAFWANNERHDVFRSYTSYYDKLADSAFSNHRDLLTTISYDPFMGVYLSSAQNRKGDEALGVFPDENYAREVMQLFSVGVYSQDQNGNYLLDGNGDRIENYDNVDITNMAKVFTGLGLTNDDGNLANFLSPAIDRGYQYFLPMQMVQEYHDTSVKFLLDGTRLRANRSGNEDISNALDVLAEHDSTAPHISVLLIKRLTSSNPSHEYIGRVTQAWRGQGPYGNGEVGNFVSVLKAILLDSEVRDGIDYTIRNNTVRALTPKREISGKVKEPILKYTQLYRFAQALSDEGDGFIHVEPKTKQAANDQTPDFGQIPMRAPSVFNYYASEYSPSVGALAEAKKDYDIELTSPESEILSPFIIKEFEELYDFANKDEPGTGFTYGGIPEATEFSIRYNYLRYLYEKNTSIGDFLDDLNLWLCNGQISRATKLELVDLANNAGGATRENFAKIFAIIFNSPDFSVSY